MHSDLAALDTRSTDAGWKSGLSMYFFRSRIVLGGMLSLSYSCKVPMKLPVMTFFAVSQSVFSPRSVHTASIVVCTSGGGLEKDFISVMSFLSSDLSDSTAAWSAGIASSRSALASSAMAFVSTCCCLTTASSAFTISACFSAASWSLATCTSRISVALDFSSSTGCSSPSFTFMSSTMALVSSSFWRPFSRRSLAVPSSSRLSPSSVMYRPMRSRYDLGVV
mmetsp:Transcript_2469/g.8770  ORF Transcript_2469/g.8770 Transcript_2469/m.8770 type:complete len:222 (-) Transcript_2469:3243-3908(-)